MAVAGFNQLTPKAACNKNLAASAKHKCNGSDLKCSKNGGDIVGIGVMVGWRDFDDLGVGSCVGDDERSGGDGVGIGGDDGGGINLIQKTFPIEMKSSYDNFYFFTISVGFLLFDIKISQI